MKTKILYSGLSIITVVLVIICLGKFYNQDNEVLMDKHVPKKSGSTSISMMYETEYQSGTYQESTDSSFAPDGYTFNEILSKCENGSKLEYDEVTGKVMMFADMSDRCYVYFDKNPISLATYIQNLYTTDGENGLYLHDADLVNGANDNSLRYTGANPDNYVCFGSDAETCPEDNLYRIIGVFNNQVKLIKNLSIGNYVWDADQYDTSTIAMLYSQIFGNKQHVSKLINSNSNIIAAPAPGSNDWATADLQYYLNNDYLSLFEDNWKNKIVTTTWSVNGIDTASITSKQCYDVEMTYETTYSAKIGLMYASEYGFAASPENWTTTLTLYYYGKDSNKNNNWMYTGHGDWTIVRVSDSNKWVFNIDGGGGLMFDANSPAYSIPVRPTFSLLSTTKLVGGYGTNENPFRIAD